MAPGTNGSLKAWDGGDCLISEHLSELPRDSKGTDAQLGLKARPHGGVVVVATSPHNATGLEVGGHGEDHGSVSVALEL